MYVTVLVVDEKDTFFLEGAAAVVAAASAFSFFCFDDSNATNAADVAFTNSEWHSCRASMAPLVHSILGYFWFSFLFAAVSFEAGVSTICLLPFDFEASFFFFFLSLLDEAVVFACA